jgi:hypothetical protein
VHGLFLGLDAGFVTVVPESPPPEEPLTGEADLKKMAKKKSSKSAAVSAASAAAALGSGA